MIEIKKHIVSEYKSSVSFFNEGDFEHFFKDIRPCIEWIWKYMIHEVLANDGLANNIINGDENYVRDNTNVWKLEGAPQSNRPEGAFLADLLLRSVYYRFPVLWNPQDKITKRRKRDLEAEIEQLKKFYRVASELAEHTGRSTLEMTTQAKNCASNISSFTDCIKDIFPKTKQLIGTLPAFDFSSIEHSMNSIEKNMLDIYNATDQFCTTGGSKFIILLPKENHSLNSTMVEALFMIPCTIVLDFGAHSTTGISALVSPETWKDYVYPIKAKDDFVVGSAMSNWFFCHGDSYIGEDITTDFKSWKSHRCNIMVDVLKNIAKKNSSCKFFILNFIDDPKYAPYIFDKLSYVFGNESSVANRCSIFSFVEDKKTIQGIRDWAEDTEVSHRFCDVSIANFFSYIVEHSSKNKIERKSNTSVGEIKFSMEEIIYYREAGLDIFGQYLPEKQNVGEFYNGAEINWAELSSDLDVRRIGYEKLKHNVINIIKNPKQKTILYTIKHHPGAGGTTMSRRLAYDLCRKSVEESDFVCLPVFLNTYNEKTYEYLLQLSEKKLDNDFLVVVVEGGKVADENINKLSMRLNSRQRNAIVLRVFRTTRPSIQGGVNITTLSSQLDIEDARLFVEKYTLHSHHSRPIFAENELHRLEVVDFPLKLKDDITSNRLNDYVSAFMDDMPDKIKYFVGFVAFATYYADKALNQNLVKSYFDGISYSQKWMGSLYKLLIQENGPDNNPTGCWRPRYQSFALPILHKVWSENWRARVTEISVDFLKECNKIGTIGQWDKDMLYSIFILRRGYDSKETSNDEERSMFSKLIEDVMNKELRPEVIFDTLIDIYPDDAVFLCHYGRYLFEKAYNMRALFDDELYIKSEKLISEALEVNPNVDDIHHIMGMLYLRKIQSSKQNLNRIKERSGFDVFLFEDQVQRWMLSAKESFDESIEINPASPYGYTAKCQLYRACLELAKLIKGYDDYSFCDNDPTYSNLSNELNSSLGQLGNLCQTYDETQAYMKGAIRIYQALRAFHRVILGDPQGAVEHYRKLFESTSSGNKLFYGKQYVTSILYARTEGLKANKKNYTAWAMGKLTYLDRDEVGKVLEYQRNQNDIDGYENLFWYKLSGNEEFSLEEAINLLTDWLHQCEDSTQRGRGKLKALYYLAVCYSALAIKGGGYNAECVRLVKKYFKQAGELAEKFDQSAMAAFSYLGDESDAHCILLPQQINEAPFFEAVITKVDRRKGYVTLPCGLEAFFSATDFSSLKDEGKTFLKGKIGFRYSGLALYEFSPVTEYTPEQLAVVSDTLDKEEGNA